MVLSEEGIYVSRFTGHDTKTCGKVSSPCRTISYGIQQLSTGTYIYLNGTDTLESPYACEASDPGHPKILISKSVSFVGIKSRAHISCHHNYSWFADGTEFKDGIQITFNGLAFLKTSVLSFDAVVSAIDTVFAESKFVSLDIQLKNLPRFDLSLNNVVFEENAGCIRINANVSKVFVNISNTLFYKNGNPSSNIPSSLWFSSYNSILNIQLRNCSFEKNTFKGNGMFLVNNALGATNVYLKQLRLKENRQTNPSIKYYNGLFLFKSAQLILKLEYGFIYKTSGTFLYVVRGPLAKINISNIEMNEFYSGNRGGGVVNVVGLDSCHLSLKDSSFRNGINLGIGGILFIVAKNQTVTIQNSTIHNIYSSIEGGAMYIKSDPEDYRHSTSPKTDFFLFLRVINSSFSNSSSGTHGGALYVFGKTLSVIIQGSSFLQCNATFSGAALFLNATYTATVRLHNSHFLKNSAYDGAIAYLGLLERRNDSSFNVSIANVTFSKNRSNNRVYGIVHFDTLSRKITVDFKKTYFIKNFAGIGGIIIINCFGPSRLCFLTLDNCIFRNNVGYAGTVGLAWLTSITCKNSIFDSNGPVSCSTEAITFMIYSNDSMIFILNTTFVNNFCRIIQAQLGGISALTITDSAFIRNKDIHGNGGVLTLLVINKNQPYDDFHAHVKRTLFKENIGNVGSILSVTDANVVFTNCTFLNNFAPFQGGLIFNTISSSVNLSIFHSVFRQTIPKIVSISAKRFVASSFLRLLNPAKLAIVNTTFDQRTKSNDPLIIVSTASELRIDNTSMSSCPLGSDIEKTFYEYKGIDTAQYGLTFSCKECDYNFYSFQRGTARGLKIDDTFQCLPCPRGADCVPAIRSKTNYWGYHVSLNPPKLAFTICPFGYCKSPPNNSTEYNACQGKRTGVMCGMCSQGYTEALWSTYCTSAKDCNDYWFWTLFLTLVFSMAIILVTKPPFVTYCLKQIFWFRSNSRNANTYSIHETISSSSEETRQKNNRSLSSTEQHKQDKRQFSRFAEIIFYFYQIAQLLLSSSSLKGFFVSQFLEPVLGLFNFQPSFTKQSLLCPFPGLTPETKLVFKTAPVFGTLIGIFIVYALHYFICRSRGAIRPAIAPYLQASIKTVFLGYVTLATVSISLIRCVFVADENRWFYNGNVTCYQWWQYASFTFIAIFVIPFIFVLTFVSLELHHDKITVGKFLLAIIFPLPSLMLWLFRFVCSSPVANVEENQNVNALKEMLLAPYRQPDDRRKRGALYWQSVLIARRFVLVLIFCIVTEPSIRLFCMTIVCVVVLYCHVKVRPFQNSLANNLESLSLFFLIILGLVNLFKSVFVGSEQNIKGSLITVFKVFQWLETVMLGLFPAVLLLLLFFAVISFSLRVLVICCRSIFKLFFRPCAGRWMSRDTTSLLNVCDNTDEVDVNIIS